VNNVLELFGKIKLETNFHKTQVSALNALLYESYNILLNIKEKESESNGLTHSINQKLNAQNSVNSLTSLNFNHYNHHSFKEDSVSKLKINHHIKKVDKIEKVDKNDSVRNLCSFYEKLASGDEHYVEKDSFDLINENSKDIENNDIES